MKIIIGADIVPTPSNEKFFVQPDMMGLLGNDLFSLLRDAEYKIFNLELPLTDVATPIKKAGPALIAPTSAIAGYEQLNINLFTIANNHIMDQGVQGLESTINTLKDANIDFVGAGSSTEDALAPYVIEKDGKKIGIYACCEHEFSIAFDKSPGANPFDPLESLDHIQTLKSECDYVVVLYHGGKEQYRYPSPDLQKICRRICDKGADLVVCQHSHCIGCEELYNSSVIVYGQGNFLFDMLDNEYWQTALLMNVEFDDKMSVEYIPVCKDGNKVRLATDSEKETILGGFKHRSQQIKDSSFVKQEYIMFAKKMSRGYISALRGNGKLFRIANKLCGHRIKQKYSQTHLLKILNTFECEAHRELFIAFLKDEINKK